MCVWTQELDRRWLCRGLGTSLTTSSLQSSSAMTTEWTAASSTYLLIEVACHCYFRGRKLERFVSAVVPYGKGYFVRRGGSTGGSPTLDGCWPKNRDTRPIKSSFYQSRMHQNSPVWAQKLKKSSQSPPAVGRGTPPPAVGRGTPPSHILPRWRLRSLRLRRSTRLAPSALDLGAYGASAPDVSIRLSLLDPPLFVRSFLRGINLWD